MKCFAPICHIQMRDKIFPFQRSPHAAGDPLSPHLGDRLLLAVEDFLQLSVRWFETAYGIIHQLSTTILNQSYSFQSLIRLFDLPLNRTLIFVVTSAQDERANFSRF